MSDITYGATVKWMAAGGWTEVSVSGCRSRADAIWKAYDSAMASGYRKPRWWEFWRRCFELDYAREWRDVLIEQP